MTSFITKVKEPIQVVKPCYLHVLVSLIEVDHMIEITPEPGKNRKLNAIKQDLERICKQI